MGWKTTTNIINKAHLDKSTCGAPDCKNDHDHSVTYLTQICHPGMGVEVRYDKNVELLIITCYLCESEITRIRLETNDGRETTKS
jgi:hypothetical protein